MTGKESMECRGVTCAAETNEESCCGPHDVELGVRRQLLAQPRLQFNSLVVRRIDDGVCLEGIVETDADRDDVDRLAVTVAGVNRVLNRLVLRRPNDPPAKG